MPPQQPRYGYYPPRKPPKKRHVFRWVVLGVIGVISVVVVATCLANAGGGGGRPPVPQGNGAGKAAVGIGDTVTSDRVRYTVTDVDVQDKVCGEFIGCVRAQGEFISVELTIANDSDSVLDFLTEDVQLVDENGREYVSSMVAQNTRLDSEQEVTFLEPINPGSTARGFMDYDVPEDFAVKQSHVHFGYNVTGQPFDITLK